MPELLRRLFSPDGFMPHGHCYLWKPELVWLHVVSDALIALSYVSIPFTLVYFVRKRRDIPFHWMFLCFGMFIIACGTTHMMEIWTLWTPTYWLSGMVKATTAAASVPTAILLVKLLPQALAIPTPTQLSKANEDLRAAHEALKDANRELEAFSYSVAHDLRAPLRGMSGFAEILLEDYSDKLDEEARGHLREVTDNASKMAALIDALLSLSRVARADIHAERVDLALLARKALAELLASEPERKVELVAPEHLWAWLDPQLARVLIDNLLGNAWKFTSKRAHARLEVGAVDAQGKAAFFVRDDGAGFDMAFADKLFAPFQRLHKTSEFPGTGIGLATVQRVVHRHGGRIWAEGKPEAGASFYFTLGSLGPPS